MAQETGSLLLAIAGDVMLGRLVNEAIAQYGYRYPWGDLLPVLERCDLFLINLECALTAHTAPWHDGDYKPFYFRADPSVVETLKAGRVSFACVANNHSCDFGVEGLRETLSLLDAAGITHAGAGEQLAAARAPARLMVKGTRISIVAFADYPAAWAATPTTPGINYTPVSTDPEDFEPVRSAIQDARHDADLVIFTIHWGPNMRARPTPAFREFAHKVMDAGVDVFWGHSAHLVQGIELYRGRPVLYDAGDLIDDYAVDEHERNDLSALFLLHVVPPSVEQIEVLPVRINAMQVNHAQGKERDWFIERFTALCRELGTEVRPGPRGLVVPGAVQAQP
jgi:poly-gamma-glutamate capsule biosynthesis protein CapA/YwtB (metallophosphatase superfamily)